MTAAAGATGFAKAKDRMLDNARKEMVVVVDMVPSGVCRPRTRIPGQQKTTRSEQEANDVKEKVRRGYNNDIWNIAPKSHVLRLSIVASETGMHGLI